ncbi:hypothetical protein DMUE_0699 [Dictyocoela muelleri]|nr:hypothetical protein DMUE_0699 [Dictyocoela muelleri]
MMKKDILPKIWLSSSIAFILLYTTFIFTKGHLPVPKFIYSAILITTYSATLYKYFIEGRISMDSNFYTLVLLFTFARPFFLIPYFFSAIYNVGGFIVARKRQFGGSAIYRISQRIVAYQNLLIKIVYVSQLLMIPITFISIPFGFASVFSFMAYWKVVSYELMTNAEMKNCFSILVGLIDDNIVCLPLVVQEKYDLLKEIVMRRLGIDKIEKKVKNKKE